MEPLQRGDWIGIAILFAVVGSTVAGVLWRALMKQTESTRVLKDSLEANTRSNVSMAREMERLSGAIEKSSKTSDDANARLVSLLAEQIRRK